MDNKDNYKNIGKKIKEERETLKLTQKELAQRAGIDFRFLGNIERGVSKPSVNTLLKISQALDIPLDILTAEMVWRKNPPENSTITKEIVRLISMLDEFDALRVLQLIRYSIELFTGKKVTIPNEIQSHLKDERTPVKATRGPFRNLLAKKVKTKNLPKGLGIFDPKTGILLKGNGTFFEVKEQKKETTKKQQKNNKTTTYKNKKTNLSNETSKKAAKTQRHILKPKRHSPRIWLKG